MNIDIDAPLDDTDRIRLDFTDTVVLITGAATGIGRAAALAFARAGAELVIGDVDQRAQHTVDEIQRSGGDGLFVHTDVTKPDDVERLVGSAVERFGGVDVAFNNAGALPPTRLLLEYTEAEWDHILSVDLKGVYSCLRFEIRQMLAQGRGGSIINTASVAGVRAGPGMSPYVAAKHGVVGLTRAAAMDYANAGVRVNAIAPGLVETPMTRAWLDDPLTAEQVISRSPLRRPAQPEEIVGAILLLASPLASYTTGSVVVIDGGQTVG